MKYLFIFLFVICGNSLFAQNDFGFSFFENESQPEINPSYLLVYQVHEDYMLFSGGMASSSKRWKTKSVVFESEKELFNFLNSSDYLGSEKKDVRLKEWQIVGIWNLQSSEKITIKLKSETVKKEKEVVIESEEWVNRWFEKSEN